MLRLMYGASGVGKTQEIYRKIEQLVNENKKVMLIVPEQFSFETERKLLSYLGEHAFSHLEVYSFTRLCHRIFELYGGNIRNYADSTAKILTMDLALREISDTLVHYRSVSHSRSFLLSALQTIEELKVNGVTPRQYEEASLALKESPSGEKLNEISTLYSVYQGLLECSFRDVLDDFAKALELVRKNHFFEGYTIFFDEFKGFTKPEFDIIEEIFSQADDCIVTLCMDLEDEKSSLFNVVKKTADRLKRMATERRIKISRPVCLKQNYRFREDELKYLERNVFRGDVLPYEGKVKAISTYYAVNEYDEVDYALSWILEQVREKKYRYRDIAIMCRSLSEYERVLKPAFEKYGIPCFLDTRFEIENFPPARFLTAVLETAVSHLETGSFFEMLKCHMLPFTVEEISELENYAYLWNISGTKWEFEFTANPRGFKGELTEEDRQVLKSLNQIREQIVEPFLHFISHASGTTVRELTSALYHLLEELGFLKGLKRAIADCRTKGENDLADTYSRVWELLMQIFDVMVATAGEIRMDLQRFSELFALAVQTSDLADRPQTLDCVMVGSPDRMRVDSPKALVILGVNDGVFPFVPSNGTLLRDEERMALSKLGLELQGDFKEKVLEERFIAYKALSAPMNDLLLTSRRADIAGEIRQPSELLNQLFRIYPKLLSTQYEDVSPLFFCRSEETSFSVLARQYSQKNDASKTLSFYFRQKSQFESRLALLEHAMQPRKFEIQNSEIAKKLFGNKIYLSPSRVEAYYRCPFSYFCRYGLNVLPRNRAEFNPMERGNVTHDILYRFVSEYGETMLKLTENEVKENVGRYLKRYMEEVMGGDAEKSKRFLASFYRLQKTVSEIILRLIAEFRQSAFKPVDFELEIGKDENLSPLRLQTADGSEILVSGTIDRVDLCEINGKKFVRVVDYKSGTKKFKLSDVYYGLNLQMILYLFILWRNGKKKYENVFPAGVLYMPAGETVPALPRSASGEETEKQKLAQYKMSGFVLEDPDVVNAMEQGGKGIFIPVELKKDGSFGKRSSLLKLEELGKMERYIDSLILKMAEELHAGEIGASPAYSSGGRPPCDYCDYGSVCGHKNTASKNPPVKDLDKGKFFEEIGGGQNAGQKLD